MLRQRTHLVSRPLFERIARRNRSSDASCFVSRDLLAARVLYTEVTVVAHSSEYYYARQVGTPTGGPVLKVKTFFLAPSRSIRATHASTAICFRIGDRTVIYGHFAIVSNRMLKLNSIGLRAFARVRGENLEVESLRGDDVSVRRLEAALSRLSTNASRSTN